MKKIMNTFTKSMVAAFAAFCVVGSSVADEVVQPEVKLVQIGKVCHWGNEWIASVFPNKTKTDLVPWSEMVSHLDMINLSYVLNNYGNDAEIIADLNAIASTNKNFQSCYYYQKIPGVFSNFVERIKSPVWRGAALKYKEANHTILMGYMTMEELFGVFPEIDTMDEYSRFATCLQKRFREILLEYYRLNGEPVVITVSGKNPLKEKIDEFAAFFNKPGMAGIEDYLAQYNGSYTFNFASDKEEDRITVNLNTIFTVDRSKLLPDQAAVNQYCLDVLTGKYNLSSPRVQYTLFINLGYDKFKEFEAVYNSSKEEE